MRQSDYCDNQTIARGVMTHMRKVYWLPLSIFLNPLTHMEYIQQTRVLISWWSMWVEYQQEE